MKDSIWPSFLSLVNYHFEKKECSQNPSRAIHFALRTAKKTETMAFTEQEKKEAKNLSLSTWGIFHHITNPARPDHQEILEGLFNEHANESARTIGEYCDDISVSHSIEEVFLSSCRP